MEFLGSFSSRLLGRPSACMQTTKTSDMKKCCRSRFHFPAFVIKCFKTVGSLQAARNFSSSPNDLCSPPSSLPHRWAGKRRFHVHANCVRHETTRNYVDTHKKSRKSSAEYRSHSFRIRRRRKSWRQFYSERYDTPRGERR